MKRFSSNLILLLAGLACAGCGPSLVKGQSPFVSVSSMSVSDAGLEATFSIRNINDVPLDINTLVIAMNSRDVLLLQHTGRLTLSIDPNTIEDVVVRHEPDGRARQLLESLLSGESDSLAFALDGRVRTAPDGDLPFRHQGFLFRVPGKPGQLRATSSRTPEER